MRIVLVVSSLAAGGAERVVSRLANAWADGGTCITILTLAPISEDHYALAESVSRISLYRSQSTEGPFQRVLRNAALIHRLRRQIVEIDPDIVISFVDRTNVRILISLAFTGYPTIVSERSNPRLWEIGWRWRMLRHVTYPLAQAVVTQTKEVEQWATEFLPERKVSVIPNPIGPTERYSTNLAREPLVIAVGRLSPEKGFDMLLDAWSRLNDDRKGWNLMIVGDGPAREALCRKAQLLGLENTVEFTGLVRDPEKLLIRAGIFVLSSRLEGFPNALIEAMACGLPAVSFDCDSGPRDIIRNDVDGILVTPEDIDGLTSALRRLIAEPETRERMAARAPEVVERFSIEKVLGQWDTLIRRVIGESNSGAQL